MNSRRKFAALVGAGVSSPLFSSIGEVSLDRLRGIFAAARHTLAIIGLAALAALALVFFRPELLDELKELSPFATESAEQIAADELAFAAMLELPQPKYAAAAADTAAAAAAASTVEQQRVTRWLSKRYRIAGSASKMLVGAAYESADAIKLDPLLILAVMAIESRFNPFAESSVGAQGLMQVMSRIHHDKFDHHGGLTAALNPVANIQVGARILKDMIRHTGSIEGGLKMYVGAGNMETDGGYAGKVMAEHARLQAVAAGKRVPTFTPPQPAEQVNEAKAEKSRVARNEQEPA
jgi:soluble lytic murein transglycosylase-like protein